MLPTRIHRYHKVFLNGLGCCLILLFASFLSMPVYAQGDLGFNLSGVTFQTIIQRISETIPNLMRLVTAVAYVMGMFFVILGIIKLKHAGEMRTMMSYEHHLSIPITYIVIGSLLIYLPSSVQVGLSTFWANPTPYAYVRQTGEWARTFRVIYMIVQFIGVVAFIRGLVMLSHAGRHGGGQGVGKGVTHIIGGILCINIYQFIQVIAATLGIQG